jgi:hypothetical protein
MLPGFLQYRTLLLKYKNCHKGIGQLQCSKQNVYFAHILKLYSPFSAHLYAPFEDMDLWMQMPVRKLIYSKCKCKHSQRKILVQNKFVLLF